ncbi:hypothetical protein ACHQM5_026916 [Ranunculus cassubicifolius]
MDPISSADVRRPFGPTGAKRNCPSEVLMSVIAPKLLLPQSNSLKISPNQKAAAKFSPELKILIDAYKKAVLSGDETVVSELEATICVLENETNALGQKVESLIEDIASQKEKFIFVQADLKNFRKKYDKDRLRLTSRTQKDVLASLLPIVDSLEGTKQQIAPETEMAKKIDTSYQGIYKQFVEILRSLNVSIVQTVGKPFDPSNTRCLVMRVVSARIVTVCVTFFSPALKILSMLQVIKMVKVNYSAEIVYLNVRSLII